MAKRAWSAACGGPTGMTARAPRGGEAPILLPPGHTRGGAFQKQWRKVGQCGGSGVFCPAQTTSPAPPTLAAGMAPPSFLAAPDEILL